MPIPRKRKILLMTLTSAMVCLVLSLGLAVLLYPTFAGYYYPGLLLSPASPSQVRRALDYIRNHGQDPGVIGRLGARLNSADPQRFDVAVAHLNRAGMWDSRFGPAWVRYLVERAQTVTPPQRSAIAVALGRILWDRGPLAYDPRIEPAIEKLLGDADPQVRINALSAAACLLDPSRRELVGRVGNDTDTAVRARASRLLGELTGRGEVPSHAEPPEPATRSLINLEMASTNSQDLAITAEMPVMIRLQTVRVSRQATPEDLLPVFDSEHPAMRDLACVVASDRFTPEQCRDLARKLVGSFDDPRRRAGAILAGMTPGAAEDEKLIKAVGYRAQRGDEWIPQQHYKLALWMMGRSEPGFDPAPYLLHQQMPRTSVILAMLHKGRLGGLDWLLAPFGSPPVGGVEEIRLLLGHYRYWFVIRRYLPDPRFERFAWTGDAGAERQQVEILRDWYLIHRPELRFDAQNEIFYHQGTKVAKKIE